MITLLKRFWRETTIVVLIALSAFLATRKDRVITETKIEYRDKIVTKVETKIEFKDRVEYKTRVITKKGDEVRVYETTTTGESSESGRVREQTTQETVRKSTESMDSRRASTRYLLGLSYDLSSRAYGGSFQYSPLPNLPIFVGPVINVNKSQFSLGIGVTIAL